MEFLTKFNKTQTEEMEKFLNTLSDDQKKAWKELTGEKFQFKPDGPPP